MAQSWSWLAYRAVSSGVSGGMPPRQGVQIFWASVSVMAPPSCHSPGLCTPGLVSLGTTAMKTLLIVFHSLTGGTRQMAEAAARGAEAQSDVHVRLLPATKAQPADVLAADGYIFATPETLAAISGLMKDFFDRTYYPALERINGRPYAILICAGSDGQNAARSDRADCDRVAAAGGCGPDHRLHPRPNTGCNLCTQGDWQR